MRFPRIKHVGNGVFREKHLTRCQCPVPDGRQGGTCGSCGSRFSPSSRKRFTAGHTRRHGQTRGNPQRARHRHGSRQSRWRWASASACLAWRQRKRLRGNEMTQPMTYDELAAVMRELREFGHLTSMPATGFGMPTLPPARVPRPGDPGLPPQGMTVATQPTPPPSGYEQYVDRYRRGVSPGEAATELGLAAAPLALGPLGAVGRAATRHPAVTGAVAGGLGLGTATEAGEPAKGDPRLDALRAIEEQIVGNRSALEKMATTNFRSTVAERTHRRLTSRPSADWRSASVPSRKSWTLRRMLWPIQRSPSSGRR